MFADGCIGEVRFFAGNFPPRNWAFCQGQLLPIAAYSALFSILGTTYGGDGTINFALPDLRGRVPVGVGTGPGLPSVAWGARFGNHDTVLSTPNLPSHNHGFSVTASNAAGNTQDPTGGVLADSGNFDNEFQNAPDPTNAVEMAADTTSDTGSNTSFSNQPPSLGIHAVICLVGIYPSRN